MTNQFIISGHTDGSEVITKIVQATDINTAQSHFETWLCTENGCELSDCYIDTAQQLSTAIINKLVADELLPHNKDRIKVEINSQVNSDFDENEFISELFENAKFIKSIIILSSTPAIIQSEYCDPSRLRQIEEDFGDMFSDSRSLCDGLTIEGIIIVPENETFRAFFIVLSDLEETLRYYITWNLGGVTISDTGVIGYDSSRVILNTIQLYSESDKLSWLHRKAIEELNLDQS